ncbi:UNVERIFIED_CONTAM: rubrerythrin [Brevibacillus sp. OAP136]
MIAAEVMLECPVILDPNATVADAIMRASQSDLDVLPLVDHSGRYCGTVRKETIIDNAKKREGKVIDLCCADAIVCNPAFPLENLDHDASANAHRTIVVVDDAGLFKGIVPNVHWAVDEAKVQSGYPRNRLEVRTYSMHLTYRCLDCGALMTRNEGLPGDCPHCGADAQAFALYTED